MSFTTNNKLVFVDSFQFLSILLDSLVENLGKDEFDNNMLNLVQQKGLYPYEKF